MIYPHIDTSTFLPLGQSQKNDDIVPHQFKFFLSEMIVTFLAQKIDLYYGGKPQMNICLYMNKCA